MIKLCIQIFVISVMLLFVGCINASKSRTIYFKKMDIDKKNLKVNNLRIYYSAQLDANKKIAIASKINKSYIDVKQALLVIENKTQKILFESNTEELPYGSNIYSFESNHVKIILWEKKGEYFSDLSLFKLDGNEIYYIGNFDIALATQNDQIEDLSYPIDKIEVSGSENILYFKFIKRTTLNPNQGLNKNVKQPLIYKLDLNINKLSVY